MLTHSLDLVKRYDFLNFCTCTKVLEIDASKYPPPPSKIAAYQVTDPTTRTNDGPISNRWVSGYQNPCSNLLCGGGVTLSCFSGICSSTVPRDFCFDFFFLQTFTFHPEDVAPAHFVHN